jgi:hypothetical protein
MRLVLEQTDFRRLSEPAQQEVLALLTGRALAEVRPEPVAGTQRLRRPVDLTPELARQVLYSLSDDHKRRLELFARKGGRVRMRDLLALTGESDWRALSYFQGTLTRKLRRFLDDPDKRIHLIGWDFESTVWDDDHQEIVDGVYYVTETTAETLKDYFGV